MNKFFKMVNREVMEFCKENLEKRIEKLEIKVNKTYYRVLKDEVSKTMSVDKLEAIKNEVMTTGVQELVDIWQKRFSKLKYGV